jgi:hypothetical protein
LPTPPFWFAIVKMVDMLKVYNQLAILASIASVNC